MAGSYGHLRRGGWELIENMGDAHECVEELWWLVERAIGQKEARRLLDAEYYPMCRAETPQDKHFKKVRKGMKGE